MSVKPSTRNVNSESFVRSPWQTLRPINRNKSETSESSEAQSPRESIGGFEVIISHGPGCNDGATAAWCIWRKLPQWYRDLLAEEGGFYSDGDQEDDSADSSSVPFTHPNSPEGAIKLQERKFPVVFVFCQPGQRVPHKLVASKKVLILDLDMGEALVELVKGARSVLLCDHHDSTPVTVCKHSQVLLEENRHKFATYVNTDKQECGATLAWRLTHSAIIPPFVQIIRIGDNWQWNDHRELHAKAVLASLYMSRSFRSFQSIERTFITWDSNFDNYVQKGRGLLEYERTTARNVAKHSDIGFIQTNDGVVYNIAYTQANVLHSEIGASIRWYAEKRFNIPIHFCATWKYASFRGIVSVSLRDAVPGINLATIAREVKGCEGRGGGHAAAAAFSFRDIKNFHDIILTEVPIGAKQYVAKGLEETEYPLLTK